MLQASWISRRQHGYEPHTTGGSPSPSGHSNHALQVSRQQPLKLAKLDFFSLLSLTFSNKIILGNGTCSGDQDTKIPLTQTRTIANMLAQQLNLTTFIPYAPWYDKKQVVLGLSSCNSSVSANSSIHIFRSLDLWAANRPDWGNTNMGFSWAHPITISQAVGFKTDLGTLFALIW